MREEGHTLLLCHIIPAWSAAVAFPLHSGNLADSFLGKPPVYRAAPDTPRRSTVLGVSILLVESILILIGAFDSFFIDLVDLETFSESIFNTFNSSFSSFDSLFSSLDLSSLNLSLNLDLSSLNLELSPKISEKTSGKVIFPLVLISF